ncbi:MAG: hypothetical protein HOM14_03905 [Gammaproteobacteria bacterium]|jgi:hypothetical protein|nr:hypothetical protein [Gammaproteobacteria bacterium]MBT4194813.1 hypothetical protein [Gammaproteobacteria bacterium]MBT5424656.1 hypothetical protein [Bacteroidota bacterium]MBT6550480.1 hypothetical protein [Gammaproteobacteria bacterium]
MNIEISEETYNLLGKYAEGFETPESVIKRLLNFYEKTNSNQLSGESSKIQSIVNTRKYTKYEFKDGQFGKGRLVLAVLKTYCHQNQDITFDELKMQFPKHLQGSHGVFAPLQDAKRIADDTGHKRHFIKNDEIISLKDGEIAVCTEWGVGNIDDFIDQAISLGYEIKIQDK